MPRRFCTICWVLSYILFLACGSGCGPATPRQPARSQTAARADSSTYFTAPGFARFAGTWTAHGAMLTISSDGAATFAARTYRWCAPGIPQPCDTIDAQGHLEAGNLERLRLSYVSGSTAYGTVLTSTFHPAGLAVTLTLQPHDTLLYAARTPIAFLCGPGAPAGACGA